MLAAFVKVNFNFIMPIHKALSTYKSIQLESLDKLKLFNRVDRKFVFSVLELPQILEQLCVDYYVVSINDKFISNYNTQYYDTHDFSMYTQHHNGKLNRYKVRLRTYTDSDIHFFELKYKNNIGRTYKSRIEVDNSTMDNDQDIEEFLDTNSPFNIKSLLPSLMVNYHRITLVNKRMTERLTIDIDLEFSTNSQNKTLYNNIVIAELKQDKSSSSPFIDIMNELRIKQTSLSKYCLGMASLNKIVKVNNYKNKIRYVDKFQSKTA